MNMELKTKMTAAQAIVECVKREGISKVFCVPGESYLPLLDALYSESSIELISARHEGGASFMAEGYAKAAHKPGIVLATRGVGAANLSIGVHTAFQDSTPMVVLLGQVHRKFRGREGFQEVDLDHFFKPISKWAVEISDPERIPELIDRAFRIAQSGRPGPVVVSLPEDILPQEVEMSFGPKITIPKPSPSKEEIVSIEKILNKAEKPLIIAGGGVKLSQAEAELVDLAEAWQIPVVASFRRHDVFSNTHPLYAGHLGLGTPKKVIQTIQEADVILACGTRLSEVTTQDYTLLSANQKLIHIDIEHEVIGKVYPPDLAIIADMKKAIESLRMVGLNRSWSDWAKESNQRFREVSSLVVTESDAINKHIIHAMVELLESDTIITNDAGNFAGWLHGFYPFSEKDTYIGPTSGAMGYGLPAAIGAKLASPNKTVVSLSGDGGFMMTCQELETAVRENIPVIALVFNNNSYGTIRMHQEIHYPTRVIGTDLGEVSFSALAKAVGAQGYTVSTIEAFKNALIQALNSNTPSVIEIITDVEQISVTSTISSIREKSLKS
ncbi:thiamine pyrophosphate-binding protein [Ornithinibacillus massiliensis]|uniref:Thiamine pyrophosphate-binding protein n=1 Tax=Ornithinibacillus massiliensis TaxID=1944633 RepID=A0ABS5MFT7_9BACI|nr:thiamine pyrophosphate-binding protein [Ornithinibacillus massiliensis]MBS3681020.1 thiamine pyrophosphate-binding protein [Ornithinibacillus massiliensis]